MKPFISVVINTLNEEANIGTCIQSVQGFADEVVVCDMDSTDKTVDIARELGAKIISVQARFGDFGRLRFAAVSAALGEWVLVLDADERLTTDLGQRLRQIAIDNDVDVVYLANLYWYFGGWIRFGDFFNNNWPRFFRRSVYQNLYRETNEQIHNDLSVLSLAQRSKTLPKTYYLKHYAYPTIEKYVIKTIGRYASIEAQQYVQQGRRFSMIRLIGDPIRSFVRTFILKYGFFDGQRGFILSTLFAAYRFAVWANVWLIEKEKQKLSSL